MATPQYLYRPILLLKDGVVATKGKQQIISNINACQSVVDILKTTLGPFGMDKLFCSERSDLTITNDGATIVDMLNISHPAARILMEVSKSQDAEEGDGTTSVIVFTGELLTEAKKFLDEGLLPQIIVKGYQKACHIALQYLSTVQVDLSSLFDTMKTDLYENCARTSLNSKLVSFHRDKFAKMVQEVVSVTQSEAFDKLRIGIKKVVGGSIDESMVIHGVAFKKTFSYAGFEMQPKKIQNPKIALLNVELELKAEKDNAEVRITNPDEYQSIVDAEWTIIMNKLDAIIQAGSQIVLSRLPIGDLATQYFADHDIFCAGRVDEADMTRTAMATGGKIQSTVSNLTYDVLGTCGVFEEVQIGSERYNLFKDSPKGKSVTIILRGGGNQLLEEAERSLNDAIMTVHRVMKAKNIVPGGGAFEMKLSAYLRELSMAEKGKEQLVMQAFAKSLESIPRTLATNCCLDQVDIMNKLRQAHDSNASSSTTDCSTAKWIGIDGDAGELADTYSRYIWEAASIKANILSAATEAASLILLIDETIKNPRSASPETAAQQAMQRQAGGLRA